MAPQTENGPPGTGSGQPEKEVLKRTGNGSMQAEPEVLPNDCSMGVQMPTIHY